MSMRQWAGAAMVGFVFGFAAVAWTAEDEKKDDKKEIPFPDMPKTAGKIDADAKKTFTETKSGLKYRILRKGQGNPPKPTNIIEIHYHGWLDSKKVFDSTYEKGGNPARFQLKSLIKAWVEGLQLIGKGGMIELEVPPDLGYGDRGQPPVIPGKATLHFIVELVDFG